MANPLITNFDTRKVCIGSNRFRDLTYTEITAADITLAKGTVFGRITSTGKVVPFDSTAVDGSQIPRFVLPRDTDVAASATVTISMAICGRVDSSLLVFTGSEDTDTVVYAIGVTGSPEEDTTTPLGTVMDVMEDRGFYLEEGVCLDNIDNPQ